MDFGDFALDQYLNAAREVEHLAKDEWVHKTADLIEVYERVRADSLRLKDMMHDESWWGWEVNHSSRDVVLRELQRIEDVVAEAVFAMDAMAVAIDALNRISGIAGQSPESWAEVRKVTGYEPPPDISPDYGA